eukprot:TRINITY_DN221_c3_g2_i2.p1 TRINITY_DN221_c3_g2~~TRINITY_DN221_c3_g2_i2.p1  ORF type:complete len:152 (-),score=36.85 TRINITY_DN221_c3_g2_i2:1058-1513(-)
MEDVALSGLTNVYSALTKKDRDRRRQSMYANYQRGDAYVALEDGDDNGNFGGDGKGEPGSQDFVASEGQMKFVYLCFLVCGVGMSMGWYSISTGVSYFASKYGPDIYRQFLAAYNIPALPLLIAQTKYDVLVDGKFGSLTAYTFRVVREGG